MEEEFQESEVIFQENIMESEEAHEENDRDYYVFRDRDITNSNTRNYLESRKRPNYKQISNSVPVTIPENMISRNASSWFKHVENFEDDEGEMIPPHVITGRRIAGKMTSFSVCSGYGRTLKGRDLSQVRNSILRMTGFLET
ncbi:hypothetical protein HAX54_012984 [Datura stramonium]|uniref:Senescence regulator n=1 Tax=Datura stramonium TaxID=4076 RepID=A0ABS8RYK3_DATST|nr:hypothetical protein [Datura stramonium]